MDELLALIANSRDVQSSAAIYAAAAALSIDIVVMNAGINSKAISDEYLIQAVASTGRYTHPIGKGSSSNARNVCCLVFTHSSNGVSAQDLSAITMVNHYDLLVPFRQNEAHEHRFFRKLLLTGTDTHIRQACLEIFNVGSSAQSFCSLVDSECCAWSLRSPQLRCVRGGEGRAIDQRADYPARTRKIHPSSNTSSDNGLRC